MGRTRLSSTVSAEELRCIKSALNLGSIARYIHVN